MGCDGELQMGWAVCVDPLWNVYSENVVNVGVLLCGWWMACDW